jgi:hypothetical protein
MYQEVAPQMPHMGVERLSAGDRQEHPAQYDETVNSAVCEKTKRVARVDGKDNVGLPDHAR